MKLSSLIEKLQEAYSEHGDMDLTCVEYQGQDYSYEIDNRSFDIKDVFLTFEGGSVNQHFERDRFA